MIHVLKPGFFTTVQDAGRWGYQAYGMPVAGVMDRYAYEVANILAGNQCGEAVLEMTMLGGSFRFEIDTFASLCGADMQAKLDGYSVPAWSSFLVSAGSILSFDYAVSGSRTYLAVHGGIFVPAVLGSRSTYTRAGIGGMEGRALKEGDVLPLKPKIHPRKAFTVPREYIPHYGSGITLRVLLGPQDDQFTKEGTTTFFQSTYTVTNEADRMGFRMEGPRIKHSGKPDIVSDALCQGAIQVPGHGQPIVMMADRQTTGGYTKIGAVIGPDLSKLAQARPGDKVKFVHCADEQAVTALRQEKEFYIRLASLIRSEDNTRKFNIIVNGKSFCVNVSEVKQHD